MNPLVHITVSQTVHTVSGVEAEDVNGGVLTSVPFDESGYSCLPGFDEGSRGDVSIGRERHDEGECVGTLCVQLAVTGL